MIRGFFFLGMLLAGMASGQGTQSAATVYQVLAKNSSQATISATVTNSLGQSFHIFTFFYASAAGHTCITPGGAIVSYAIQGSFDKSSLITLPVQVSTAGGSGLWKTIYGYGSYPYVFVTLNNWDNVNCTVTVSYAGSLYPPVIPLPDINSVDAQGFKVAYVDSSAPSNVFENNPNLQTITILSVTLSNNTAGQTVSLVCLSTPVMKFYSLGAGQVVNLPYSGGKAYQSCSNSLSLNLTAATPVSALIAYRFN